MSRSAQRLVTLFVVATMALSGALWVVPAASAGAAHLGAIAQEQLRATTVDSTNWAGYAATGTTGEVTSVYGTWVEPAVTCNSTESLAAFWVGIDGYSSPTVEQTGTLALCFEGAVSYVAWWEIYPTNSIQVINTITVSPGDHFSASVAYDASNGKFTMKIKDVTTGKSFSKTRANSGSEETSAECIAEAPTSDGSIVPLADFGKVSFGTCTATIGNDAGGIGTFPSVTRINMVNDSHQTKALTSALSGGIKFHVTWERGT
jgi:hypothetical protein